MPYSVRIEDSKCNFSACHFLFDHNKCSRLHGHNYHVSLEISGQLSEEFFVVDFFDLKTLLLKITDTLDHHILLPEKSPNIKISNLKNGQIRVDMQDKYFSFPKSDCVFLPLQATTAELLSKYIYDKIKEKYLDYVVLVEVSESQSSVAKYGET